MLIYGTSKWNLKRTETLHTEKCNHCNSLGTVDVHIYTKYVHVFWIPFCPLPKEVLTECSSCKNVQTAKEMPAHIKEIATNLKKEVKIPFYYWLGSAALALLIFLVFSSIQEDNKRTANYAISPKEGDVYEIKYNSSSYTLYKVSRVLGDTVFFSVNQFESNQQSGLSKPEIVNDSSYLPIDTPFTKKEISIKLSNGEILKIRR
jgi:hypothetical protein